MAYVIPGQVSVTAHHASGQGVQSQQEHQWRVLRFNDTRQSVARVIVQDNAVHAAAGCLAFEYLKTMAAAGKCQYAC